MPVLTCLTSPIMCYTINASYFCNFSQSLLIYPVQLAKGNILCSLCVWFWYIQLAHSGFWSCSQYNVKLLLWVIHFCGILLCARSYIICIACYTFLSYFCFIFIIASISKVWKVKPCCSVAMSALSFYFYSMGECLIFKINKIIKFIPVIQYQRPINSIYVN